MGGAETRNFYYFGILERVPGSQNQLCLSLETPGYLKTIKNQTLGHLFKILFLLIPNLGKPLVLTIWEKTGTEQSRRSVQ